MPDEIDALLSEYTRKRVDDEATRQGVPVDLARRIAGTESAFRPDVITGRQRSSAGAIGTMQLMPGTAKDLGVDPYSVEDNISGGIRYLKRQLNDFGDPSLAAAAYNAGPGNVRKYKGVPPIKETQDYVQKTVGQQPQRQSNDIDNLFQEFQKQSAPQPTTTPKPRPQASVRKSRRVQPPQSDTPFFDQLAAKSDPLQEFTSITPEQEARQNKIIAERKRYESQPLLSRIGESISTRYQSRNEEGLSPEERADLDIRRNALGIEPYRPQTGFSGVINQATNAAARGLVQIPQGAAELADVVDRGVSRVTGMDSGTELKLAERLRPYTQGAQRVIGRILPTDPNDKSFLTAQVPQAVGSLAPFAIGGAVGAGAKGAALLGAAQNAAQTAEEFDAAKADTKRRDTAIAAAGLIGTLEALGLEGALSRIGGKAGLLKRALEAAGEGAQEVVSGELNDINAKLVGAYDPNRPVNPLDKEVALKRLQEFGLGAAVGAGAQGLGAVAERARATQPARLPTSLISSSSRQRVPLPNRNGSLPPIEQPRAQQPAIEPATPQPPAAGLPAGVSVIRGDQALPAKQRGQKQIPIEITKPDGTVESVMVIAPEVMNGRRVNEASLRPFAEHAVNQPAQPAATPAPGQQAPAAQQASPVRVYNADEEPTNPQKGYKLASFTDAQGVDRFIEYPSNITPRAAVAIAKQQIAKQSQAAVTKEMPEVPQQPAPTPPTALPAVAPTGKLQPPAGVRELRNFDTQPQTEPLGATEPLTTAELLEGNPLAPTTVFRGLTPLTGSLQDVADAPTRDFAPGERQATPQSEAPTRPPITPELYAPTRQLPREVEPQRQPSTAPTGEPAPRKLPSLRERKSGSNIISGKAKPIQPFDAIYKGPDGDVPVKVIGTYGVSSDGIESLQIEGSNTSIPGDRVFGQTSVQGQGREQVPEAPPRQPSARLTQEPTNRITEGEGAELPRTPQRQLEGQPIETPRRLPPPQRTGQLPEEPAYRRDIPPVIPEREAFRSPEDARRSRFEPMNDEELDAEITRLEETRNTNIRGRGELGIQERRQNDFDLQTAKKVRRERLADQRAQGRGPQERLAPYAPRDIAPRGAGKPAPPEAPPVQAGRRQPLPEPSGLTDERLNKLIKDAEVIRERGQNPPQETMDWLEKARQEQQKRQGPPTPPPVSARSQRTIQHSDFGEVTPTESQKGVPTGKLRVTDADGAEHVIQKPTAGRGNRKAALAKAAEAIPQATPNEGVLVKGEQLREQGAQFKRGDNVTFRSGKMEMNDQVQGYDRRGNVQIRDTSGEVFSVKPEQVSKRGEVKSGVSERNQPAVDALNAAVEAARKRMAQKTEERGFLAPVGRAASAVAKGAAKFVSLNKATRGQAFETLGSAQTVAQLGTPGFVLRNIFQHGIYNTQEKTVSAVGAGIDKVIGAFTGRRAAVAPDVQGLREYWDYAKDAYRSKQQGRAPKLQALYASKNQPTDKAARILDRILYTINEVPDAGNYGRHFSRAVDSITKSAQRSGIQLTPADVMTFAKNEAEYLSFRNKNFISETLKKFKAGLNYLSSPITGTQEFGLGDFVVKYTQIPGALTHRAIVDYSPIGLLKASNEAYQAIKLAKSDPKASFIHQRNATLGVARALSGTATTIGGGALLGALGILVGPEDRKNETLEYAEREEGLRGYSLNLSALWRLGIGLASFDTNDIKRKPQDGDLLVRVDWAQPIALQTAIGAELFKRYERGELTGKGAAGATAKAAGTAVTESFLGMLDALGDQTVLKNFEQYRKAAGREEPSEAAKAIADTLVKNLGSSFVPGVLRQARYASDPMLRDTRAEESKGIMSTLAQAGNTVINATPFSRTLPTKATLVSGGEGKTASGDYGTIGRILAAISPVQGGRYKADSVIQELTRLQDANPDEKLSISMPKRLGEKETKKEGYSEPTSLLREREFQYAGQFKEKAQELINSPRYARWTDEQKAAELNTLFKNLREQTYKERVRPVRPGRAAARVSREDNPRRERRERLKAPYQ
jgi:transglycosylase-like protein with SLT domain